MRNDSLIRPAGMAMAIACTWLLSPSQAWAYVDPNASGYIFQLLFPIITAIGAGFVFLRQKIANLLKRMMGKSKPE